MNKKRSILCQEYILFSNSAFEHFEMFFFEGTFKINLEFKTKVERVDLNFEGLAVNIFCNDIVSEVESIMNTFGMFLGGMGLHGKIGYFNPKLPKYLEDLNRLAL